MPKKSKTTGMNYYLYKQKNAKGGVTFKKSLGTKLPKGITGKA